MIVQNNFPNDDVIVNTARGLFGLNMLTTLPLECFVCREVLETYFFAGEFDRNRHLIFTSSLVVTAMIISLLTCDLGIVLELTGGLSATALAFIFPSLCYLKLTSETGKRVPTADLPHLTSSSWRDQGSSSSANNASTRQHDPQQREEEHEALIDQSNGSIDHGQNPIRANEYDAGEEEEPSTLDRLERMEGGRTATHNGSARDSVDIDDVELPLRPGASVRFRPAAANRKWWQSTRPLSVACAIFGTVVLVISGKYEKSTRWQIAISTLTTVVSFSFSFLSMDGNLGYSERQDRSSASMLILTQAGGRALVQTLRLVA